MMARTKFIAELPLSRRDKTLVTRDKIPGNKPRILR